MRILAYLILPFTLGTVLVAGTDKGICAILLGDTEAGLIQDLHERFPQATWQVGDVEFEGLAERVVAFIDQGAVLDVPLDTQGSDFQKRVWAALREIPSGQTITYAELARRIGAPATAVRAVAGACGANPLAVVIPCHRVVRGDGGLAGYRWGLERKAALLKREGTAGQLSLGFTFSHG